MRWHIACDYERDYDIGRLKLFILCLFYSLFAVINS